MDLDITFRTENSMNNSLHTWQSYPAMTQQVTRKGAIFCGITFNSEYPPTSKSCKLSMT